MGRRLVGTARAGGMAAEARGPAAVRQRLNAYAATGSRLPSTRYAAAIRPRPTLRAAVVAGRVGAALAGKASPKVAGAAALRPCGEPKVLPSTHLQ